MLTDSLAAMTAAKTAKTDFLETLVVDISTAINGTDIVKAGDAIPANVATFQTNAAKIIGDNGATTLVEADYGDTKKSALQDVDMQTAVTKVTADLNFATSAAKVGMTALIQAAEDAKADLVAANKAEAAAGTELAIQTAAFNAANAGGKQIGDIVFVADYSATANNAGKIIISDGKAFTGQNGTGAAVALSALVEDTAIKRVADIEAAELANVAAAAAAVVAETALEDAVGAIYVLEAGGHSVKTFGGNAVVATADNEAFTLDKTDVAVFKTAADAALNVVQQEITFGAVSVANGTVTIDGTTVDVVVGDAATTATAIAGGTYAKFTAALKDAGSAIVVFTAKTSSVDALEASDIVIATATLADPTIATATEVNIGDTFTPAAAAKADTLLTEIGKLEALNKAIDDFKAARDLTSDLAALDKVIDDATAAITNSIDDAEAPGLGYNIRTLDQGATTKNDVFLFEDAEGTTKTIANFGKAGDDVLFFGEGYSFVSLGDKAITTSVGGVAALEVFYAEVGGSLTLWVENETFGGNLGNETELTKIVLTGVKEADFVFDGTSFTVV